MLKLLVSGCTENNKYDLFLNIVHSFNLIPRDNLLKQQL